MFLWSLLRGLTKTGGDIWPSSSWGYPNSFTLLSWPLRCTRTSVVSVTHPIHFWLPSSTLEIPTPSWVLSLFPPGFSPAKPKHSFSSEIKTLSLSGFSLLCLYPAQPKVLPSGYYCNTPLVFLLLSGPCPCTLKSCSSPGLPTSRSLSLQTNLHRGVCISASV